MACPATGCSFSTASSTWSQTDTWRIAVFSDGARGSAAMKVLQRARLIDGTGAAPVADATVVVSDQRIAAVTTGSGGGWPNDAEIVDVSGMTILPGLIDCHDHLAIHGYDLARRSGVA